MARDGAEISVELANLDETKQVAKIIAEHLRPGDVIGLSGPLGVGKTEFLRAVCLHLGVTEAIQSPTFVGEHQYSVGNRVEAQAGSNLTLVSHWDLYRIHDESVLAEIYDPQLPPARVTFVEWPERLPGLDSRVDIKLEIQFFEENWDLAQGDSGTRRAKFFVRDNPLLEKALCQKRS